MQLNNPPIPWVLRLTFGLVALVVLLGASLLLFPALVAPRWPWTLTPFSTRFLGAVYLSELIAVLPLLVVGRWDWARSAVSWPLMPRSSG